MPKLASLATVLLLAAAPQAELVRAWPAPEAKQGVAVDAQYLYAVDNSAISKMDRASGRKIAEWKGDPKKFPHTNSCAVLRGQLVCAASNYPETPMISRVELFDPVKMQHSRTVELGRQDGSLTWVDWREDGWWAGFANYDGRGGEAGRDHRASKVVQFDAQWRAKATWTFPDEVLQRMKPYSNSGGAWGADGLLYVTGHDRPEIYVLSVPPGGGVLKLVTTIASPMDGQAIAFDRSADRMLYGVRRATREVVAMRLPKVN